MVSITLSFVVFRQDQRNTEAKFERLTQYRVAAVEEGVANAIGSLHVVNQLFVTNGDVSKEQFHSFTYPLLLRYPYIEAFSFRQRVPGDARPAFEGRMRSRYPGFTIDNLLDGKRVAADAKTHYDVIEFVEPMAGKEWLIGLDTSTHPSHEQAIRRADDTGLPSPTGVFHSFRNNDVQRSFQIMMAVYRDGVPSGDLRSRRAAVVGHTVAVLRIGDFFEKIFALAGPLNDSELNIRVYASASVDDRHLAYSHTSADASHRDRWWPTWMMGNGPEPFHHTFDIAGSAWHMVVSARPAPYAATYADALLMLLLGCLATYTASTYLRISAFRTQRIEQLVEQRTDELNQVNTLLSADIKKRKQVELALASSEQRSRELADLSSDWYWEQDQDLRFTIVSIGLSQEDSPPLPLPLEFGRTRWELPADPDASNWLAHRTMLEMRLPFKNFEYKINLETLIDGRSSIWVSVSGKPLFDADGRFKGYRGTGRNITDRKETEEALHLSGLALHKLAGHQEMVREHERRRIARDIHDDLGQNLLALRLDVEKMTGNGDSIAPAKEQNEAALLQIDLTIKAVRRIINDLRPVVLDLGLHAAVEWQAKEFQRRTGIVCELHIDHEEFTLDDEHATALFRIVQESLSNVLRHAKASHVRIGMRRRDGRLFMDIADDGIGFPIHWRMKENIFGLIGIEERLHMLGGTFDTASSPGGGATIMLSIRV